MNLFVLLPFALTGLAVGQFLLVRRILAHWTMTQRREAVLFHYLASMSEMFVSGEAFGPVEVIEIFNVHSVKLADECFNQRLHIDKAMGRGRFWLKVPDVGESWPDFQPAPIEDLDEEDDS